MSLLRRRMMMAEADKRDALFKLRNTTDFDGIDDYVDTGIKLFDVADDWTIYFAVDLSQAQGGAQTENNIPVFHCIYELSPWPGISLQGDLLNHMQEDISAVTGQTQEFMLSEQHIIKAVLFARINL